MIEIVLVLSSVVEYKESSEMLLESGDDIGVEKIWLPVLRGLDCEFLEEHHC